MRVSRKSKHVIGLAILFLFLTTWMLLPKSCSNGGTSPWSEASDLKSVLKRASMNDRTVIFSVLHRAYARPGSLFDLLLESFRLGEGTARLLNHLVILAADTTSFQYCHYKHPHCVEVNVTDRRMKNVISSDQSAIDSMRFDVVKMILELGYHVLYTDLDVLWLRNPFPRMDPDSNIAVTTMARHSYSDYQKERNKPDGGLLFVRSDIYSISFFVYWHMMRSLYPNSPFDSILETVVQDQTTLSYMGIRQKYFNSTYFGGFCQLNNNLAKVATIRANCCDDLDSKIHDMMLLLEDWRNFRAGLAEKSSSEVLPRAPSRCFRT